MKILITGSAGFIGFNLAHALLKKKHVVYGIDSFDNYYSKKFKTERNKILKKNKIFLLNNSGNHYRDFTYIKDVVKILLKLVYVKKFNHKVINICSSKPIKIKSIINFFIKKYTNFYVGLNNTIKWYLDNQIFKYINF